MTRWFTRRGLSNCRSVQDAWVQLAFLLQIGDDLVNRAVDIRGCSWLRIDYAPQTSGITHDAYC